MSKSALIRIAAATAVAALPLSSALADSMNMTASATITAKCQMVSTGTLTFDTSDQVAAPALTPTLDVKYKCTTGTNPGTFTLNGSTSPFTGSLVKGSDTIPYTVTWGTPGAGQGFSTPVTVTLNGSMAGTDYQDKPAGAYNQTVSITVAP